MLYIEAVKPILIPIKSGKEKGSGNGMIYYNLYKIDI
jgi:hypothetical protein